MARLIVALLVLSATSAVAARGPALTVVANNLDNPRSSLSRAMAEFMSLRRAAADRILVLGPVRMRHVSGALAL
jgi:hypothetical protein